MIRNPFENAGEYRQAAKDRRERSGGHAGRVYSSSRAMFEDRMRGMSDWEAAVYEARYRMQMVTKLESENLVWLLSEEYWSNDIPF